MRFRRNQPLNIVLSCSRSSTMKSKNAATPGRRIAQPVQAMLRLDQQLIALDPRARVIGRPQPDQLRA
jgi:hypothetical protein